MKPQFKKDLVIFILIFGVLTLPFLFTDLDITIQRLFYSTQSGWPLVARPFWKFIYKYGIFLGYFVTAFSLVVISVSYWKKAWIVWRKAAFFLFFVMLIGPGIMVNGIFKDHWGRPRPREITEFGGVEQFQKVWVKGNTDGKSFPCGHASMGFFLSIPFLFLRKKYKTWAWLFFIFGTLYGLLIGYVRMIGGGHFASDVLWAAGMVWFTAILSYHLLGIDKPLAVEDFDEARQKQKGKLMFVLLGLLLPVITIALLLATPYISKQSFTRTQNELQQLHPEALKTNFIEGYFQVSFDTLFHTSYSVNAFGFPNSKIGLNWATGDTCHFWLSNNGWFTEVRNQINLTFPYGNHWKNILESKKGVLVIRITNDSIPSNLRVNISEGEVHLKLAKEVQLSLDVHAPEVINGLDSGRNLSNSAVQLDVTIKKGKLFVESLDE